MKNVLTIFVALLVSSAVFAMRTTDPSADNSIAFIKTGSVVKVIYSSDKESNTRVTITDLKGKEVFSESVRSRNGFTRRYNLSQLGRGNYIVRVSDGKKSRSEIITLQPLQRVAVLSK
ncbi:MAG TPA: T9SS type A sorting domain-containing protein [Cyclobacteriaceae bacterium]|nr:T9SS type A sorting domain-containing protein [Cyclobacteriaceae bacterium]HRJ83971.1 T9SS type A sorting domain-containing protein [Cyclobacteriaceae bacterium]